MTTPTTGKLPDCWLPPKKVCEEYPGCFSVRKLQRYRRDGTGPKFTKAGRVVLYRRAAIEEWLASREFENTAEARVAGVY